MATTENSAPQKDRSELVGQILGVLFLALAVVGNTYIVEYIGSTTGRPWLAVFIEQHVIWSNIIYLYASISVMMACIFLGIWLERFSQIALVFLGLLGFLVFFTSIVIGIYGVAAIGWSYAAPAVHKFIEEHQLRLLPFMGTVIVALGASYGAYYVRAKWRIIYGVAELGFGTASILFSIYAFVLSFPWKGIEESELWKVIFSFFTGVYIIVRGLANVEEGLDKGPLIDANLIKLLSELIHYVNRTLRIGRRKAAVQVRPESR
jgi:MFS family permease